MATAQEVPELKINSKRYIVIDAETGEVFAQRNADERVAMASLTKVLTTIEAIESAPPEFPVTTAESDLVSDQASQMGFDPGETFTLQELLYGLMLPSGNDAAQAIARALGAEPGDNDEQAVDRFMARLNERVRNMGLVDTNLVNPSGWGVPNHYSSAHDLAVFTMYALRYPRFVELISTKEMETSGGYRLRNNNRLLGTYESLLGGKTGYDDDAGWCLIEVAQRDGNRMISVTLDGIAPDDWYDDNRVLLEYALDQKAARAPETAIAGERVGYLDPDAAMIARAASAGASIGAPPPADAAPVRGGGSTEPDGTDRAFDVGTPRPAVVVSGGRDRRQALVPLAVAVVVTLGAVARALRHPAPLPVGLGASLGLPARSRRRRAREPIRD